MTKKHTEPRQWWESRRMLGVLILVAIFYCVYFSRCHGDVAILTQ